MNEFYIMAVSVGPKPPKCNVSNHGNCPHTFLCLVHLRFLITPWCGSFRHLHRALGSTLCPFKSRQKTLKEYLHQSHNRCLPFCFVYLQFTPGITTLGLEQSMSLIDGDSFLYSDYKPGLFRIVRTIPHHTVLVFLFAHVVIMMGQHFSRGLEYNPCWEHGDTRQRFHSLIVHEHNFIILYPSSFPSIQVHKN